MHRSARSEAAPLREELATSAAARAFVHATTLARSRWPLPEDLRRMIWELLHPALWLACAHCDVVLLVADAHRKLWQPACAPPYSVVRGLPHCDACWYMGAPGGPASSPGGVRGATAVRCRQRWERIFRWRLAAE